MKELEERILKDGKVYAGDVLKVDGFLNHQMDVGLFRAMGREWARRFAGPPWERRSSREGAGSAPGACGWSSWPGSSPCRRGGSGSAEKKSNRSPAAPVQSEDGG